MYNKDVRFGVNYTPRLGWFHSWLDFNPAAVKTDLAQIRDLGLDHVRIFPLWPLLQPNRSLIRSAEIDKVVTVIEIAHQMGLEVWVDCLQGHLSSFDFLPSWVSTWHSQDLFTSEKVKQGQRALIQTLGERLSGVDGLAGFCVGNEFYQFAAPRHPAASTPSQQQARAWLDYMLEGAAQADPQARVVHSFDDDLWFVSNQPFTPELAVTKGAMTTVHSWVFAHVGPHFGFGHPALVRFARYLLELADAWGRYYKQPDRPVWLQEVGAPLTCISAEQAPDFVTQTLRNVLSFSHLQAVTWWCSHDVSRSLADFPQLEYTLGLFDEDGRIKPTGVALTKVIEQVRSGQFQPTPPAGKGDIGKQSDFSLSIDATTAREDFGPTQEIFATWMEMFDRFKAVPGLHIV